MNRRDSVRPAPKAAPVLELERLARQLGTPDQGLLDAASETWQPSSEPVDLSVVPKFVEESAEVCVAAHARLRECSAEQRGFLRGCSLDLIGLAGDQVLRLERSYGEYRQSELDVKGAAENLAAALERAEALSEQARSVIQTVAGVPQLGPSAEVEDPVAAFSDAIKSQRDLALELLERGSPSVRKRCTLYALDQSYVQTLEAMLNELGELSRKATDAALVARKKVQVERTLGCARPLIEQLVHAFENASRLDKNIPLLRAAEASKPRPGDKKIAPVVMQKTAVLKPIAADPPRRVEKLALGANDRFKR